MTSVYEVIKLGEWTFNSNPPLSLQDFFFKVFKIDIYFLKVNMCIIRKQKTQEANNEAIHN